MKNKFLPCPFCGWEKIRTFKKNEWTIIQCELCWAQRQSLTKYKKQLYAEWNVRNGKVHSGTYG